jgi:hypothetical protein
VKLRFANPLYDSVFKYLVEDATIARPLLERLIGMAISDLEVLPQELSSAHHAAVITTSGPRQPRIYRVDFAAKITLPDGTQKKVLIELQKSHRKEAVGRFRNYLSRNYFVPANATSILPVVAVYMLGFNLPGDLPAVVRVKRQYLDGISGELVGTTTKSDFIEQLTHDAVLVQIPKIPTSMGSELERALQLFNQSHVVVGQRMVELSDEDEQALTADPFLAHAIRVLLKATADADTLQQMDLEDEVEGIADEVDSMREALGQTKEQLGQTKEQLGQTKEQLGQRDEELAASRASLQEEKAARLKLEAQLQELLAQVGKEPPAGA